MQSWDDLCLNKGPTLTVIETTKGRVFGGYTSQSRSRSNNDWSFTEDEKAWIFSFDRRSSLRIKQKHKQYAINNNRSVLCGFGLSDINIELIAILHMLVELINIHHCVDMKMIKFTISTMMAAKLILMAFSK